MISTKRRERDKYLIDLSSYEIVKIIKQGGFGIVYLVRNRNTNKQYAAKVNQAFDDIELYKRCSIREITIMMQIQNPTIIGFRGFSFQDFYGSDNVTLLMDFAERGSLYNMLVKEQKSQADLDYDNTTKQIIMIGIAYGMMLLHKNHIIHRDLTPNNILLDEQLRPHISDFGLSKYFNPISDAFSQSKNNVGTAPYMSPEIIDGRHYNLKTDVYSFGIILFEIICGHCAYPELVNGKLTVLELTRKVVHEDCRPAFRIPIKHPLKALIQRCWSRNPAERPTFEELFNKLAHNSLGEWDDYIFDLDDKVDDFHVDAGNLDRNYYYLDNVDSETVLDYIEDITSSETIEIDQMVKKDEFLELKNDVSTMRNEFNEEFNSLKNENSDLQSQLNEFQEIKTGVSTMQQQFNEFHEDFNSMKNENVNFANQFNTLQEDFNIMKIENTDLKNQLAEFKEMKTEVDAMLGQFNDFQEELNSIKQENIDLKSQIKRVEKKHSHLKSKMKKKMTDYENANSDLKSKIEKMENQMQEMSLQFETIQKELLSLKEPKVSTPPSKRRHSSKIETVPLSPIKDMSLPIPFTGNYFNGIMDYLVKKYGNEQIYSMVDVSASITEETDLINTVVPNPRDREPSFIMNGGKKAFICYLFKTLRIKPTAYSIQTTNHPKKSPVHLTDWIVETSSDGKKWTMVDRRKNVDDLNDSGRVCTYVCLNPGDFCSLIRITNQSSHEEFGFRQIEFFGDLTI